MRRWQEMIGQGKRSKWIETKRRSKSRSREEDEKKTGEGHGSTSMHPHRGRRDTWSIEKAIKKAWASEAVQKTRGRARQG